MRRARLRPFAIGALALVAALAVVSQLALPPYLEGRVGDRLTRNGGSARVSLSAVPAARLLADHGKSITVSGRDLAIDLTAPRQHVFERLDGFDRVSIVLADIRADPFNVSSFRLTRRGEDARYRLAMSAVTSGEALARFAASRLGGILGGALGELTSRAVPLGRRSVPLDLEMELESAGGEVRVVSGGGTIAGLPTGPIAALLAGAVISRL